MIRKIAAVALLACLASGKANADFLHTDWQADGDSLATLHEETGLEWLKINSTLGMSYNDVLADSKFEGWRVPSASEVETFWMSIFASSSVSTEISKGGSRRYTGYNASLQKFTEFVGKSTNNPLRSYVYGYTDSGDVAFYGLSTDYSTTTVRYGMEDSRYDLDFSSVYAGVFLVSDGGETKSSIDNPNLNINNPSAPINTVSTPVLMSLLSFGGLMIARRRGGLR